MFRLLVEQTLARRGRLALTMLAVTLGVTFVTGSLVLTDTSQSMFDDQFRTGAAGVDVTVRDDAAFDSAMGVLAGNLISPVRDVPVGGGGELGP